MQKLTFTDDGLLDYLETATKEDFDAVDFGVIGMSPDGVVTVYNRCEAGHAGLTPSRVLGRHFFKSVGPCTNNYLIAHRFETETHLDAIIDYVFTFRMAPSPVTLRMLKRPDAQRMYLLVRRRPSDEC